MSRRTQLTTKFIFQVLAQLSENFIFIYLGLTLSAENKLVFKPLFILVTVLGICAARYFAVFPLSKLINWTIRFRARRTGAVEVADELPYSYQVMLFWAGLRGAVGVALAAGLKGNPDNVKALQATVLVVVVLTVIIFGGTTARMLEIMGIRTGVVDEVDSDDEFDIETAANGTYYKSGGRAVGNIPRGRGGADGGIGLGKVGAVNGSAGWDDSYSSGSNRPSPPSRPHSGIRQNSATQRQRDRAAAAQNLLARPEEFDDDWSDADLPPPAPKRSPKRRPSPPPVIPYPTSGTANPPTPTTDPHLTASGAIRDLFTGTEDHATWFKRLDDGIIKPTLLLDQSGKSGGSGAGGSGSSGAGGAV